MLKYIFPSPAKDYIFLYQITLYYSNSEFLGIKVQPMKSAQEVAGATVIKCGISNEDIGAITIVCETKVILVVDQDADTAVLPATAPNEEGPPLHHISKDLKNHQSEEHSFHYGCLFNNGW